MYRYQKLFVLLLLSSFAFFIWQNQRPVMSNTISLNSSLQTVIPKPSPTPSATPSPTSKQFIARLGPGIEPVFPPNQISPIRKIDFENFTYPEPFDWDKPLNRKNSFKLKNREYVEKPLSKGWHFIIRGPQAAFADLTDDGNEEAILILYPDHQGTAIYYYVYFYTLIKGKPEPIWAFESGDRADGGLKEIRVENGELVIELEGKNKYIGGDLYAEDETSSGACCPTMYTRARYKWNGKRFVMQGKPESFPLNR